MSIKSLFNNKTETIKSEVSASALVESERFVDKKIEQDETFQPYIDFSDPANFAKFGSAEEYYKNSIERIHDYYPYDGSDKEKIEFDLSSSYLDRYIFDKKYPKTNGHVILSYAGWGTQVSTANGFGLSNSNEYIEIKGALQVKDGEENKPLYQSFDNMVTYDEAKNRTTSLRMNMVDGITVEFWLKKNSFDITKTNKEVVLDLWNGNASSSSDYGRFTLALSGTTSGEDTFVVTLQSGTVGFYEQAIGTATVTTSSLANWHHYALSFVSQSSGVASRLYVDGTLNESKSLGSSGINEIGGKINGYIGALQTSPSGSSAAQFSGKLSASLDDFRFWKKRRTSQQIYNNWYSHVPGGTNTEDNNVNLGVYYKFNEGILNSAKDSVVLDYSGRLSNGSWTGYTIGARLTSSAFVESGLVTSEPKDPIIYETHPDVVSLKDSLLLLGKQYDQGNPGMLYSKVPVWIRSEDEQNEFTTKKIYQIISSYFDTLYAQITSLPYLKNKIYPSSSYSPLPFSDKLLENKGLVVADLFANSNVLEHFNDRDLNQVQFEKKITDVKNLIYTNIYNNLEEIYKQKGTEDSVRNMLRCFGIDDEIVKLNVYTDNGTQYFTDTLKQTSINKKLINFDRQAHNSATIFNESSPINNKTFISGSGIEKLEQYNALTSEISIIVPRVIDFKDENFYLKNFVSSSIFGVHQSLTSSAYTWASPDLANFQVYLVKDEPQSSNAKFVLKDYDGNVNLETDFYKEIYSNEKWNLAVRIKPEDYPIAGNVVTSSNRNYTLEFYGVTHAFDTVKEEFMLSASLNYTTGSAYLSNPKRFYIGAHKTNFTSTTLEKSDIKVAKFGVWLDYLDNFVIKQHNLDVTNKGTNKSFSSSTIFGKNLEQIEVPSYELAILDWDFETVTTSDSSGEFTITDTTSGSTDTRYGWVDNITRRKHDGKGHSFPNSTTDVVTKNILHSFKKELPEISYVANQIKIKENEEEFFVEDLDVSDSFYSLEKSMNQVVSEEMLKTLSTAKEMSNLMGEAVERYRLEYKKLNHVRRMFFEDVEADVDFDRFTEYFKWIDSAVSSMIAQMFPASVRFSKGISDIVESHIFERNKYQNKFPLISTHTATEGSMQGLGLSQYKWEFGHAPIEGGDNNCLWQKERAERTDIIERETIKDVINNRNNAQATILAKPDKTNYSGSTYAIRRFSKPIDAKAIISQTFHPGINYSLQKDRDYVWNATNRHSELTSLGVPKNVLVVGAGEGQGIELPANSCRDIEIPNEKKKFNATVFVGKFAGGGVGGSFSPINDSASYTYAVRGKNKLPFNIFSGNVSSGYNSEIVSGYKTDAVITNIHTDTTDFSNDVPLQGPFARQWVGGHQSRHININHYDASLVDEETLSAPANNIDNQHTRPEAYRFLIVENSGPGSDGALGLADPQYGVTSITGHPNNGKYPNVARKSAVLYRDGRAKRPFNISNIQTTTSSYNHGNFYKNYEIISVGGGKQENNLYFRKNVDTRSFLPSEIGAILPKTTNYQTLVAISNHTSGNVFGVAESNIHNSTTDPGTQARISFALNGVTGAKSIAGASTLSLTASGLNHLAETNNPNSTKIVNTDANLILRTGSLGLAIAAKPGATGIAQTPGSSHSGLSSNGFAISFWYYSSGSGEAVVDWRDTGLNFRHRLTIQNNIDVRFMNLAGASDTKTFVVNTSADSGWAHYLIRFDVSNLASQSPRLWKNGQEVTGGSFTPVGGTTPTVGRLDITLMNGAGMQDIVLWTKEFFTDTLVQELYAGGNWDNPSLHSRNGNIVDWYRFGYESYWSGLGGSLGTDLILGTPSAAKNVSSSFGSGSNPLNINVAYDEDFVFMQGNNPYGPAKTNSVFWNELTASLKNTFTGYSVSTATNPDAATFTMLQNIPSQTTVNGSETGTDFASISLRNGVSPETGYANVISKITESVTKTIISSRFSAPGSMDTLSYGFLDAYSQEYSVYNNLNYRNMSVRGIAVRVSASADGSDFYNFGGSGEAGTIRVNDHRSNRDGLKSLLSRHSGKFGIDPRYASELGSEPLLQANPDPSFHKLQRNENRRPSDTSTIAVPVFVKRHDNAYINSPIPRSDFQYKWITSSLGSNYSITSGKQRMYGYADPTGILSSSVVIDGDSGFVPAITFPTASEIFGV